MIEQKELDFIHRSGEKQRVFREYKIEIQQGLGLGVTIVPDIQFVLSDRIVTDMAANMVSLSEELEIPLPHIGLISSSEEAGLISILRVPGYVPLATTKITPEYPQGVLEFSSKYLKHVVEFKMGREVEMPPKPLEWVEAHEAFHLWQHRDELGSKVLAFHFRQFEKEGMMAWENSPPEINANEFANRWLERVYSSHASN